MIEERLKELNITLPEAPPRGGNYTPLKYFDSNRLVYCSGFGSTTKDCNLIGKVGVEISEEQAYEASRNCMLNLLAAFKRDIGSLDKIQSFVKMLVFVASDDGFYNQPEVANGATDLLQQIFGIEIGLPARSAIGVNVLPGNIPVEIEILIQLKND